MIVSYFPPEGRGADAELQCGSLPASLVPSKTGGEQVAVNITSLRNLRVQFCRGGCRAYGSGCRIALACRGILLIYGYRLRIERRVLLVELCEELLHIARMDERFRCGKDHPLAEGGELQDVAVPAVAHNRLQRLLRQRMLRSVPAVIVLKIVTEHILNVVRTILQLGDAETQRAERKEEIRAEEELLPKLCQVLRGARNDADLDIFVLRLVYLAHDAFRPHDTGKLRLDRERQLVDALNHQRPVVAV